MPNEFKYKPTTALRKIQKLIADGMPQYGDEDQKVFIIQGGQGAGKTIALEMLIIDTFVRVKQEITICSAELSKLKGTALNDFIKIMQDWGFYSGNEFNIASSTYKKDYGHFVEFIGLDKADVGKGRRRKIVYINESNKITLQQYADITARADLVIMDYNPDKRFWGHDLINAFNFINLTYKDNEYLSQAEVSNILSYKKKGYNEDGTIKSKFWANKWKVFGLGEVGALDGVILEDWEEVKEVPPEARLLGYGMDFGFSNSYTSVVGVYEYNETYILDEVFYKRGVYPYQIYQSIKDEVGSEDVWADHARPDSIKELKDLGLRIRGAEKPRDAMESFLDKMNRQTFFVSSRSENIKHELNNWTWAKDKGGESLNVPIKEFDHAMDAVKYLLISKDKYSGRY